MTPNWTTDRPTKPGEYWLSIDRDGALWAPRETPADPFEETP